MICTELQEDLYHIEIPRHLTDARPMQGSFLLGIACIEMSVADLDEELHQVVAPLPGRDQQRTLPACRARHRISITCAHTRLLSARADWRLRGGDMPAVAALASAPARSRRQTLSYSPSRTCAMSGVSSENGSRRSSASFPVPTTRRRSRQSCSMVSSSICAANATGVRRGSKPASDDNRPVQEIACGPYLERHRCRPGAACQRGHPRRHCEHLG